MNFYNHNGIKLWDEEDKSRGKIETEFLYTFRFWNGASYKIVSAKSELRFYAQDGRARIVMANIRYNLQETDVVNIRVVRVIKNVSRIQDSATAEDPSYPYSIEKLDEKKDSNKFWSKFFISADFVTRSIVFSIENTIRDYGAEEEGDKW